MKPVLTAAILAVVTLALGATLVRTCSEPSSGSPSFSIPSTGQSFAFSAPASIQPGKPQTLLLRPGVHQSHSPSSDVLPKDRDFVLSKPVPLHLDKLPYPTHLPPGVYQTYPYTIILMVPGTGMDDRIFGEIPNANSRIPTLNPHVEVVPKSWTRP